MNNIKQIRMEKGMSQVKLAELVGVSQQHVSEWETFKKFPTWQYMLKISKALNASIDELFVRGCENVK